MSDRNLSLFGDDQLGTLLDQVDELPMGELTHRWPERMAELFNVLQSELARNGVDEEGSLRLAAKCSGAIAWYLGGRATYLPTGETLKAALRDNLIFAEFNGRNIEQLSRKHGLSHPAIYKIVARQRSLLAHRLQPDMFAPT